MVEVAQYSIARFRPFPETGEFANIGIVAARGIEVTFKVVPKRYRRVTQFFNTIEPTLFARTIELLTADLEFIRGNAVRGRTEIGSALRTLTMRNDETTLLFSEVRTILADNSLDETVEKLYSRYIGRNFANADYTEQLMARSTRSLLRRRGIDSFHEQVINDGVLQVKFPLVSNYNGTWVIKPIALTQKTPLGILDHAATWHDRINFLIKRGTLDRGKILIPLAGPRVASMPASDEGIAEAYKSAQEGLRSLRVGVVAEDDEGAVLAFAREGAEPHQRWLY